MLRSFAVYCDFQERKSNIKLGLFVVVTLLCKVFDNVLSTVDFVLDSI
jgi:hypothetical protein